MKSIYIYGLIWDGEIDEKYVQSVINTLEKDEELTVYINSPGGSVFTGIAIYNLLLPYKPKIKVIGQASSIASVIACAGEVQVAETALMLIHNPWILTFGGDANYLKRLAKNLDTIKSSVVNAYAKKTDKSEEEISKLMDKDEYLTPEECVNIGLADKIYKPDSQEITALKELYKFAALKLNPQSNKFINNNGEPDMNPEIEITNLKNDLENSKKGFEDLKIKFDTAGDRNKELSTNLAQFKTEIETLNNASAEKDRALKESAVLIASLNHQNFVNEETAFCGTAKQEGKLLPKELDYTVLKLVQLRAMDESDKEDSLYNQERKTITAREPILPLGASGATPPPKTKPGNFTLADALGEGDLNQEFADFVSVEADKNNRSYGEQATIETNKLKEIEGGK